jgi:hypothetical protein
MKFELIINLKTAWPKQMGALQQVYTLLVERTGIRVPEVERLFASFA